MESTTYLLIDENGKEHAIFWDTLFIDVGRFGSKSRFDDARTVSRNIIQSLRTKIMTLPDDVIVYPAHGASACGKT
jgi:glyoxylase-like metal-dependent hydrolase (beta-lactamase superfamily II)